MSEDKIIGAMARCNTKNIVGLVAQPSFSYKDSGNYIIVTNVESQFLIEYAIVPLDLKWRLINPGINNNIIVSWQHWKDLK